MPEHIRPADTSTPVVVLKLHHGSLGIMRSLGRWGVPVYTVSTMARAPILSSRYLRRNFAWDVEREPPPRTLEYLSGVSKEIGGRPILIPTSDKTASFTVNHAEALKEWFSFPVISPERVLQLTDKRQMYFLAKQLGVPTPSAFLPQSRAEVVAGIEDLTWPVMLKGIDGARLEKRSGRRMMIVQSSSELLDLYERFEENDEPNLMIQEYIPGGDDSVWMFNGYFDAESKCLAGFTGQKIRQHPIYTGATSLGKCVHNEAVHQGTVEFMQRIGYRGILDIGYRFDARDGLFKVLDVNPRVGSTFRLFVSGNGLDVVRCLYLDLTGQEIPHAAPLAGRKWIVEDKDLESCFRYWRDGKLTVVDWLKSLWGIRETAWFAWDDPIPFLRTATGFLLRASRWLLRLSSLTTGAHRAKPTARP